MQRNEGIGLTRGIAPRSWLSAPLAAALALSLALAFLLSLAGVALGATRARANDFAVPLDRVAQPFDGVPALGAAPTVEWIEPALGSTAGGTEVVIAGTGFTSGAKVTIGGDEAAEVKIEAETEIKAKTPAHATGAAEVVVTAEGQSSTGGPDFTYIAPPKVSGITPAEGTSAGGTNVKIKGIGFREGAKVKIGSEAKSVAVVSETEITARTAASSAGKDEVVVSDADGTSTGGPDFSYIKPPTVTKVEPSEGTTAGGAAVKITGTGFLKGATVAIGGAATSVVVVGETEITAKTPAHAAGSVPVVVTEGGVSSGSSVEYTYVTPPTVTSVTPAEGSTAGGATLKIKGTGFTEPATVKIGNETTEVTVVSTTEITAKTASVSSAGKDEVIVTDGKGVSVSGIDYTYITPPTVTKVEPAEGTTLGGTTVKIKGTGFLKGATVAIGGAATSVVVVGETEITAKTPAHAAGAVPVVVTEGGVSSGSSVEYTYVTPPSVTKIEPANGPTTGGTEVVITGTGFTTGAKVKIGSETTEVTVESLTEIKAKTAATAAGKDEVVVTDSKGVSGSGPSFTYIGPPTVTSITPAEGSTAGGTAVKIKGTGFQAGSKVKIGSEATEPTVVSETEMTAKTASASGAGKDEVIVSDADGTSTKGPEFTYIKPPTVTKVEPSEGTTLGGAAVKITGTGFLKGATVAIGGAATSVVVVGETEITAKTPAHAAGAVPVVVTEGGVSSGSSVEYTYVTPPTVTSVTPAEGSTAGGATLKIKGTGFTEPATVKIGNETTEVTVVSTTEITAKTASVSSAGKDEVIVTDGKGVSSSGIDYTYITPPTVTKVEPAEGTTLGGTTVKIKGTGFLKGATVAIGGAATSVVVVGETEITAKTPAHAAGAIPVVVTEGGVSSGSSVEYTYVTPPSVTKIEPASGPATGGTEVVITGTGFTTGAKVKIGSETTEVTVESLTEIKAKTAATAAGKDEVIVTDSKGVSSSGPTFTYIPAPKVSGVTPAEGSTAGGTVVKIKGTSFQTGAKVTIGAEATEPTVVSETEMTAKTASASGAAKDEVVVSDADGTSTGGPDFSYIKPPTVTKVEPSEGTTAGGAAVKITGTGFLKGATVAIGGAATSVVVVGETEITAKTPAHAAGSVPVVVTEGGVSSGSSVEYTYVTPPTVTSVTPAEGSTAGGATLKIKGTGFTEPATVKIGNETTEVTVVSTTEITAKTASVSSAGKDEVIVTDGKGVSVSGIDYTYITPPTVTKVEPAEGTTLGGTTVKIKGTGFLKGATVAIGGAATSVVVVGETEITAKTPAHAAGAVPVVVTEGGVSSGSSVEYTYVTPPSVTKIEPANGPTTGGTEVVITGTGFTTGAKVKIGSETTEVTVESLTEIKAKTAATAAGKDEVVVTDSKGVSGSGPSFTYIGPPTVTSITPAEGSTAGGTAVKIKGTGFQAGSKVKIGSEATEPTVVSETEMTAKTASASGAGKDEVIVSDADGTSTKGPEFTYIKPPTVTKVEPSEGTTLGGAAVKITGTGFLKGATVAIGGAATSVVVVGETEITAKTPAHAAGAVPVVVTEGGVSSGSSVEYTYVTPPTVTSVTPAEGSTAGGATLKIKGTGFTEPATVKIGNETTEVTVVSTTEITAKTASVSSAGKDEVIVTDGKGVSSSGIDYTYITPPTVTKVEPAEGTTLGGTTVKIKGTGFLKGATVAIGGAATSVVVVGETEITAKTPAHAAGAIPVVVTEGGVSSGSSVEYTYVTPPSVTKIEPASGPATGGTEVVITGTGFTTGAKVKIGSETTEVTVESLTEIKAKTAATAAGKDEVIVTDSKGVSSSGPTFTYIPAPKVTSISPAEGTTAGGTVVKIKGTSFQTGAKVKIGSEATEPTVVSETEITAKTASGTGKPEVVVTDADGASTGGPDFTYITPPTVTKVEPSEGTTAGGAAVKITGTGFLKGATVAIGGAATSVVVVGETEITAKTPAHAAGSVPVVVTEGGVSSGSSVEYTYVTPPTITKIEPSTGPHTGGREVVLTGTGFTTGAKVTIGGTEATEVTVVSGTEITAKTPAGTVGKAEVVVTDSKGVSTSAIGYTYT